LISINIVDLDENTLHRYVGNMIAPEQSRASRAWLKWSQADLAERANVGLSTIRDFENGARKPIENNILSIIKAFEAGGVEFINDNNGAAVGIKAPAGV
jgi:DNA-binding transcriptional regulator YiaG